MAKKIYSDEEARQRKIQHQKEYSKRSNYTANNKYNKTAYSQLVIYEKKDVTAAFKEKCERLGMPQRQVILNAIKKFLTENNVPYSE